MSCYAYKEDTRRFVDIFNRTVEVVFKHISHPFMFLGLKVPKAVGPRHMPPCSLDFLEMKVHEIHLEMASRDPPSFCWK